MVVRIVLAAEKIAVQRQDDLRLVEMKNRTHRLAECLRRRALMNTRINRVVSEPFRFRKFVGDDFLQPRARRRRAAFGEERQAFALIRCEFLRQAIKKFQRFVA